MFFDDEAMINPHIFKMLRRGLDGLESGLEATLCGLKNVPTHTEDGIPIRKLYVANLPPKTTRAELFGVFAQFGFIRSCWMRMGDKGPNKTPMPTYAFVTFSDPADAHRALLAPNHEKTLRGRNLRISPADSWHQPNDDSIHKKRRKSKAGPDTAVSGQEDEGQQAAVQHNSNDNSTSSGHVDGSQCTEGENEDSEVASGCFDESCCATKEDYTMLDVLNRDCLHHIYSYVPIQDLIISERVSKAWQSSVQEYLEGLRLLKTSWWPQTGAGLTTAKLRRLLRRLGALLRLHIDHHWSALNDRTAHTIGKFCPHLEELKVVGMHTKNWNPLIYGCRNLRKVSFISCNKLTDSSLVHTVKQDSGLESITVANNTHVTGLFLTGSTPPKLKSLCFYNCYSLQGTVLNAALDALPGLKCLKLDVCPITMWKVVPHILKKLPVLEELSLSEYTSVETTLNVQANMSFCEALSTLRELRILTLSRNIYVTDDVLKQVAKSCTKLETLDISGCNSRKSFPHTASSSAPAYPGVTDEGVKAVCAGCSTLRVLDVSYLRALSDAGLAAAALLPRLAELRARGNPALSAMPVAAALSACHELQEVDLCGCDGISEEVIAAGVRALEQRPRRLTLRLAATAAADAQPDPDDPEQQERPTHRLLTVNTHEDRSKRHLRPDFVDSMFDDGSDDSLQEMFDAEDFDEFLGNDDDDDDDLFLDDDDYEDYEAIYAYGINAPEIYLF